MNVKRIASRENWWMLDEYENMENITENVYNIIKNKNKGKYINRSNITNFSNFIYYCSTCRNNIYKNTIKSSDNFTFCRGCTKYWLSICDNCLN